VIDSQYARFPDGRFKNLNIPSGYMEKLNDTLLGA
jgi:hypothetical protein